MKRKLGHGKKHREHHFIWISGMMLAWGGSDPCLAPGLGRQSTVILVIWSGI